MTSGGAAAAIASPDRHLRVLDGLRGAAVLLVVAYHSTKRDGLEMLPDVQSVLLRLYSARVRLGVVSAGLHVKQAEKLVRLDAVQYFDPTAIFFTDQMGISKPNPKLYRRVLERLSLDPGRCLYVGDNPTHDIDPCNDLGWTTARIRRSGRHAQTEGRTKATYEIRDFLELRALLQRDFQLD